MEQEQEFEIEVHRSGRAFSQVTSQPWAIEEGALLDIINIASRSNLDIEKALAIKAQRENERMELFAAAGGGEYLKGTRGVFLTNDGTAIVPLMGSLFRRADWFDAVSGAMSMEMIERDLQVARASKKVDNFFLDVDSPGGTVNYTEELARTIRQIAEEDRLFQTFASGMMCSAALWIGAATQNLAATPNSIIGSCGVISTYVSTKKAEEARGYKRIQIVSSNAPKKALDPDTKEGYADIKQMVDVLGTNFSKQLAIYRGLTQAKVESWEGGVLIGHDAQKAGMIDRVAYRDQILGELAKNERPKTYAFPSPITEEEPGASIETTPEPEADAETLPLATQDDPEPEAGQTVENGVSENQSATINMEPSEVTMAKENNDQGIIAQIKALVTGENPTPATEGKSARELELEAKARTNFLNASAPKVLPAAREQLGALYEAAQAQGIEAQVEAFVEAMPNLKLTQDTLPRGGNYQTAEQGDDDDEDFSDIDAAVDEFTKTN